MDVNSVSQWQALADNAANGASVRSFIKTAAEGAQQGVRSQKLEVASEASDLIAKIETVDTSKYSDAGKAAHAALLESLKDI